MARVSRGNAVGVRQLNSIVRRHYMREIPASLTLAAAALCGVFAVLVTLEVGFGANAAILTILAVLFFLASTVRGGEWLRKALVWLFSSPGGMQ